MAINPNPSATSDETETEATGLSEVLNVDLNADLNGVIGLTVAKDADLARLTMDPEATLVESAR